MESEQKSAGQELAARRRVVEHVCAVCKRRFNAIQRAHYCSRACANRAYWRRRREQRSEFEAVPPLVAQLDAFRAGVNNGQPFAESTADLLNAAREERLAELP